MSTVQAQVKLTNAHRQAIIAAVAAGIHQTKVAQQFGVHRNTVRTILKEVQNYAHPGNPLSSAFKDDLKTRAVRAIQRGLDHEDDPIGAMNGGIKVLSGIGEFVTGQRVEMQGNVAITFAWQAVQEPEYEAIDVTPNPQISE